MADGDPAAPAVVLGLAADVPHLHPVGRVAHVEMHVDVHVPLAGDLEHPVDLPAGIDVAVRHGADDAGAAAQALDQQGVGAGVVEQALLREHANFQVHRPGIVVGKLLHPLQPAQADAGIDLDVGADARGAPADAALQGAPAAVVDVLWREVPLGGGGQAHGLGDRSLRGRAAVQDAGLVQVQVGLDQAGHHQAAGHQVRRPRGQAGRDGGDAAGGDADVHRAYAAGQPGAAHDEVHHAAVAPK